MAKFYSKEEINFLKENAEKFGAKICAEKLDRSLQGVISKINRLGLKINLISNASQDEIDNLLFNSSFRKLSIDFNLSKTPKELAYFLGFLWADGYVHNNELRIEITDEDAQDLERIFMKIATFKIYKRKRQGRKPQTTFYYKDKQIFDQIVSLGKYPNSIESHKKILEYIPEQYHIWFLRGLIDGDGCFYIRSYKNTVSRQFSIASSIDFDWTSLLQKLLQLGLPCTVSTESNGSGSGSHLRCSNSKNIKEFIKILYNEQDGIYLNRKYNKAKELL